VFVFYSEKTRLWCAASGENEAAFFWSKSGLAALVASEPNANRYRHHLAACNCNRRRKGNVIQESQM